MYKGVGVGADVVQSKDTNDDDDEEEECHFVKVDSLEVVVVGGVAVGGGGE